MTEEGSGSSAENGEVYSGAKTAVPCELLKLI